MKIEYNYKKFLAFILKHLSHQIPLGLPKFHMELASLLGEERVAIAAPRGHSKSTICSIYFPLYLALEYPKIKILLVSSTVTLASEMLDKIKTEVESNESLISFYGNQVGNKWNNDKAIFENGSQIMVRGAGQQVRGFRPNVIIGDDLETDEMVVNSDRMKKFDDWFWNVLVQTLQGGEGKVVIIGTLLDQDSFLSRLINLGRHKWKTRLYQAATTNTLECPLWPEMFTTQKLFDIKKEMGDYGFAQEYMNDPIPPNLRVFKKEHFQFYDVEPKNLSYFTAIDPASKTDRSNDCTAIVTVGVDHLDNIYIVDVYNKRSEADETIDAILSLYITYKQKKIAFEDQAFQLYLKKDFETECRKRRLYPMTTTVSSEGRRKLLRIEGLQPLFSRGKIFMRKDMFELQTQLLRFPSPRCHDDIIDALAYIPRIIQTGSTLTEDLDPMSIEAVLERSRMKSNENYFGSQYIRTPRNY